jgi:hypothetical protein
MSTIDCSAFTMPATRSFPSFARKISVRETDEIQTRLSLQHEEVLGIETKVEGLI